MSLIGALNIGSSALAAQQAAIQVTGNNISNAGNADYTRQVANLSPSADQHTATGLFVGTGRRPQSIQRQIDDGAERAAPRRHQRQQAAATTPAVARAGRSRSSTRWGRTTSRPTSARSSRVGRTWPTTPQDTGLRQVVLQNGQKSPGSSTSCTSLSGWAADLPSATDGGGDAGRPPGRADRDAQRQDRRRPRAAPRPANALRDQRDAAVSNCRRLVDVRPSPSRPASSTSTSAPSRSSSAPTAAALTREDAGRRPATSRRRCVQGQRGTAAVTAGQIGGLIPAQAQMQDGIVTLDSLART